MLTRRRLLHSTALAALASRAGNAWAQSKNLSFVGWSQDEASSKAVLAELFQGFRQAHADVKLETIGFPWAQMQQNVLLRMRSGQALDVVQLAERWLPQFGATGKLVDLNEVFGRESLAGLMSPAVLRLGQYRGRQLGLPWTAASLGMVANAKVLKDAGINTPPLTTEAFVVALRAIKKAVPQVVPYALTTKNNNSICPDFQVWLWTFGGRLFDDKGAVQVNSPAGVKALSFMAELVKEGLAAKDIDRPDARRMFAQHQAGFYQDAPLARGFARNNSGKGAAFDAHVLPVSTPVLRAGDAPQSFAWGHVLVQFGTSAGPNSAASRLMRHLALSTESQLAYARATGLFPVTNAALAASQADAYVTQWVKAAAHAQADEVSQWGSSADLTQIVGEEVQSALLGQKTPQAALDAMSKRLRAKLPEQNR